MFSRLNDCILGLKALHCTVWGSHWFSWLVATSLTSRWQQHLATRYPNSNRFSCERHYVDTVLCKNCNPLFRQVFAGFCESFHFPKKCRPVRKSCSQISDANREPKSRSLPLERWHLKWAQVSCVQPPFCHPGLELAKLTEFSGYGRVRRLEVCLHTRKSPGIATHKMMLFISWYSRLLR